MPTHLLAVAVLLAAGAVPSAAFDLKSTTTPGRSPPSLGDAEIGLNRADGRLFYKSEAGTVLGGLLPDLDGSGSVKFRNGLSLGRYQNGTFIAQPDSLQIQGAGSTGDVSGMSVTPATGSAATLGALANPTSSPLVSKFRATAATYEDFAAAGDGKAWTASADVCPAINAAGEYLRGRGGGTLMLPPGVANCATTLRLSNMSHIRFEGQGVGAFEQSGTELRWTGTAGATMFDMRPTTPQTPVSGVRLAGIVFNGNGLAGRGLLTRGLKDSTFHMLIRDTTKVGWDIDIDECRGPLALGSWTGKRWSAYITGSGGTDGVYANVPLQNAGRTAGNGALARVTITNGSISDLAVTGGGADYVLGDILSIDPSRIGGTTGVFITAGNTGNAATTFLDTSQLTVNAKVTQLHPNSLDALGVKIGMGSAWLDTNSSTFTNILTLTQKGTGLEIQNADTIEFPFVRTGNQDMGGGVGIGVDLLAGQWDFPSSARVLRFGTVSATHGLVARGASAFQPSTRNIVEKYNFESGELPPVIEPFADINIKDDQGNPIGNQGFTVNRARPVYTPTVTRLTTAATTTTATADYRRYGREVFNYRAVLTVQGGTGAVRVTLPCTPARDTALFGYDRANAQTMVQGRIGSGDPSVYLYMADGTAPPANFQPIISGGFECAATP